MGKHATDLYELSALARTAAISAAEVLDTDYAAADFKTLWYEDSRSANEDGQYQPVLHSMPMGFPQGYDQIEFIFNHTATSMTACVLRIEALMPSGNTVLLDTVTFAAGRFPSTRITGTNLPLYISVVSITGTSLDTLTVTARGIKDVTNAPLAFA